MLQPKIFELWDEAGFAEISVRNETLPGVVGPDMLKSLGVSSPEKSSHLDVWLLEDLGVCSRSACELVRLRKTGKWLANLVFSLFSMDPALESILKSSSMGETRELSRLAGGRPKEIGESGGEMLALSGRYRS